MSPRPDALGSATPPLDAGGGRDGVRRDAPCDPSPPTAFWTLFGGTLAVLLLALLSRTTGIHGDENMYLRWASDAPLGDSRASGKPPLFYLLNYADVHALGAVLGRLRPLSLHLTYVVLCSFSLAWLTRRLSLTPPRRLSLWALLLLSPLFVFSSTQVMMETPVLALLTLLYGLAIQPGDSRGARAAEAGCAVVAMVLKESAIPAVAAIAAAAAFHDRRLARRLVLWIAASVLLAWGLRGLLRIPPQEYGGIDRWSAWLTRAPLLSAYLELWVFLVGPLVILAALLGWLRFARDPSRSAEPRGGRDAFALTCGLSSLIFTLGVCLASNQTFARYAFPTIWVGALAGATWVVRWSRPTLLPILVLSVLLPTANLWVPRDRTFSHWPAFITHEAIHSGLTVMFGVPTHGWALRTALSAEPLCALVPDSTQRKHAWAMRLYFSWAIPEARVFDETEIPGFEACPGRKAIVTRTFGSGRADCRCPDSPAFRHTVCAIQPMASSFDRPGDALNVYCLP